MRICKFTYFECLLYKNKELLYFNKYSQKLFKYYILTQNLYFTLDI